jgi:phospholipase C
MRRLGPLIAIAVVGAWALPAAPASVDASPAGSAGATATATPITHLVVIFQENVPFDHYFGTYPNATNPDGEPRFVAKPGTPTVDGLTPDLLTNNPNADNPFRFDRSEAVTCDMDHAYTAEQLAFDNGMMDRFEEFAAPADPSCDRREVMGYFDGNTVTAMWNYAQRFAMSDRSFGSTFGPSTPGALNLAAGTTAGATPSDSAPNTANGVVIGDPDPQYDDCSGSSTVSMAGRNVGNLLKAHHVTWGWFEGGFDPSSRAQDGTAACATAHKNIAGSSSKDYIPHHEPFQYWESTANPHHLPPSSIAMVGRNDRANHQYDLKKFWQAVAAGHMPAVSFLKAPAFQDGHAGYSDPLDEQRFVVQTINRLQQRPEWKHTAIVIGYDDSDGWYDHVMGPISSPSNDATYDQLTGAGMCGTPSGSTYLDRCGLGPRLPLLVISPYARRNFVDHTLTEQASILRFIEDNWKLGRLGHDSFDARADSILGLFDFGHPDARKLLLDPATGEPRR